MPLLLESAGKPPCLDPGPEGPCFPSAAPEQVPPEKAPAPQPFDELAARRAAAPHSHANGPPCSPRLSRLTERLTA